MHSIAPPMHNYISQTLGLPWQFINRECPTIDDVVALFRAPTFAGGVVTMPYKKAIIPFLDELDDLAAMLGACNNVYLTRDGRLRGTNTDWRGIRGCLLSGTRSGGNEGRGKPALVIGAGGASRAALYTLVVSLGVGNVYVVNRDQGEVEDLIEDSRAYVKGLSEEREVRVRHVREAAEVEGLETPFYVVGTVPDFEAKTEEELLVKGVVEAFLKKQEKGVLLDMCYKPRNTRILRMGRSNGWRTVDGTGVIAHQIEEQWRLWAGAGEVGRGVVPKEKAWGILRTGADESTVINF